MPVIGAIRRLIAEIKQQTVHVIRYSKGPLARYNSSITEVVEDSSMTINIAMKEFKTFKPVVPTVKVL